MYDSSNAIKATNRHLNGANTLPYAIKLLSFDEQTTCLQAQTPHPFQALTDRCTLNQSTMEKRLKSNCAPLRTKLQKCVSEWSGIFSVDNVRTMYTNSHIHIVLSVLKYARASSSAFLFLRKKEKKSVLFLEIGSNYKTNHTSFFLSRISNDHIIPIYFVVFRQHRFTSNGCFVNNWPQFIQFMLFYLK